VIESGRRGIERKKNKNPVNQSIKAGAPLRVLIESHNRVEQSSIAHQ
jgi:hypothetical protein